ncbi:hypothetical protein J2Z83_003719 [Virgibacillus natechei]|uniref:Uncharacterized protein n=1 Tax=Virgibacillus natechei TaxID=1216297 RepID=A0ABS4IKT1_9BACI|nr:hypothetical protein [Virgibacillus natechei]MBP1971568.1 hypothetical protein [Virgibacillus natechei]UZD13098.1 hypothetical protein OLD84_00525 [Virgibacillus natechei]
MTLDPKPEKYEVKKKTWEDLNNSLNFYFTKGQFDRPYFIVNFNEYEMSKEEIIEEAETKGYKVTEHKNDLLRFE